MIKAERNLYISWKSIQLMHILTNSREAIHPTAIQLRLTPCQQGFRSSGENADGALVAG